MKSTKISVVIPAWNEEHFIEGCLQSLQQQTYTDFEIIVVDNNCTDNTVKIAEKYGAIVVKEPIQGMTPARERGFKAATGSIIARTDADSRVAPDWLERIHQAFEESPDVVGITGQLELFHAPTITNLGFQAINTGYFILSHILMGHAIFFGPNMAIRKAAWEKINVHMDDSLVHEDVDLSCHLAEFGRIVFIPTIRTTYSLRRIKKNHFFMGTEYGRRFFRTVWIHHPYFKRVTRRKTSDSISS